MGAFKGWQSSFRNPLFAKFPHNNIRFSNSQYLLIQFPSASAAYSVRLLNPNYSGPCLKVRRASDNATLEINFDGNKLNTRSISTFCAGSNGFLETWYDQSGNANHLTQLTLASQPQIASAGTITFINNNPAIYFDGVDDFLALTTAISAASGSYSATVTKRTADATKGIMGLSGDKQSAAAGSWNLTQWSDNIIYIGSSIGYGTTVLAGTDPLFCNGGIVASTPSVFINGFKFSAGFTNFIYGDLYQYMARRDTDYCIGYIQENVIWPTSLAQFGRAIFENQKLSFTG